MNGIRAEEVVVFFSANKELSADHPSGPRLQATRPQTSGVVQ